MDEFDIHIDPKVGISDQNLSRYIGHLAKRGVQYQTIQNYISMGVRRWHIERELPWTSLEDRPRVRDTQQGARRYLGDSAGKQKLPITIEILGQMRSKINLADPFQLCLFTAVSTGLFCLLRKGNLAVKNAVVRGGQKDPGTCSQVPKWSA